MLMFMTLQYLPGLDLGSILIRHHKYDFSIIQKCFQLVWSSWQQNQVYFDII